MRRFISFCAVGLVAAMPLVANANVESCATTLLQAPMGELLEALQINNAQSAQLQTIRYQSDTRRSALERRLEEIRAERARRGGWDDPDLAQAEATLLQQLESEPGVAMGQATRVLLPWQLNRCASAPYARYAPRPVPAPVRYAPRPAPAPVRIVMKPKARVIVHRAPAPVVHRVPKRAVRPVPSRVHRAPSTPPRVAPRPQPSKSYGKAPGYKAPAKGDHKSHR